MVWRSFWWFYHWQISQKIQDWSWWIQSKSFSWLNWWHELLTVDFITACCFFIISDLFSSTISIIWLCASYISVTTTNTLITSLFACLINANEMYSHVLLTCIAKLVLIIYFRLACTCNLSKHVQCIRQFKKASLANKILFQKVVPLAYQSMCNA